MEGNYILNFINDQSILRKRFTNALTKDGKSVKINSMELDFETGKCRILLGKASETPITWYPDGRALHQLNCFDIDFSVKEDFLSGLY